MSYSRHSTTRVSDHTERPKLDNDCSLSLFCLQAACQMNFEKKPEANERTHKTHDKCMARICVLRETEIRNLNNIIQLFCEIGGYYYSKRGAFEYNNMTTNI